MNGLSQIVQGRQPKPRRTTVYGTHGVGKSSYAARALDVVFLPTEDGLSDIDCTSFPLAESFSDVMAAISALFTEQHDYRTLAIDSLDWLEQLIWRAVCKERGVSSIEDIGYGRGYTFALEPWRKVLDGLSALRNERDMHIVLIAHSKIERFQNPETDSYDRFVPRLHRLASALIQEWSDEVLFACFKVFTKQTDEGFDRKRTQGISTGERILRTTERPSHIAKNRLGLPDELPLDWEAYAQYFNTNSTGEENGRLE